jgi:hypothetical protein
MLHHVRVSDFLKFFLCSSISIPSKTSALVGAACVMAMPILVTSRILMTRTSCYAVVSTIPVAVTVTHAVPASSRRHGGSPRVTNLSFANVSPLPL